MHYARAFVARFFSTVLVASVFASINSSSRADTLGAPTAKNSLRPGVWALQFEVSNADLSGFEGATIFGKYQFSRASAIRAGVGVFAYVADRREHGNNAYSYNTDVTAYQWSAHAQYQYYASAETELKLYFLIGMVGSHSWLTNGRTLTPTVPTVAAISSVHGVPP